MRISTILIFLFFIFGQMNADEFIGPDEIKPGMKGYGLSVFKGWEPERFDVEVVDVMRNFIPKGAIILVRLSGAGLEKSGVLEGMSGSPVYIDGRLAGAVAFTWPYSKEPICGVRPIGQMLQMKAASLETSEAAGGNPGNLRSIASPLTMQGFTGDAWKYVREYLSGKGDLGGALSPGGEELAFPGGSVDKDPSVNLKDVKPGDAVAVKLVEGDFRLSAIGTVTYVSNNDIYIFGHPMDGSGKVGYPISKAYIYSVVPTGYLSFKIGGAADDSIGAAVFDGRNGVYCQKDKEAGMIPVGLTIQKDRANYRYQFKVVDNANYFPVMASGAVSSALLIHTGSMDDKRLGMTFEMTLDTKDGEKTVKKKIDYAFVPANLSLYTMMGELSQYLGIFYYNSLSEVQIKDVQVRIEIQNGSKYYSLEDANFERREYYPGENLECRIVLREYLGNYIETNLTLQIPENAKAGSYQLLIGSEKMFVAEIAKNFPRYYSINSIEDLVRMASLSEDIKKINVGLVSYRPGMQIRSEKMDKFPEKYISYFPRVTEKGGNLNYPDVKKWELRFPDAVFGLIKLPIVVANKKIQYPE